MHSIRWLPIAAVTMLALTGCKDQQARDEIAVLRSELNAEKKVAADLGKYLGQSAQPVTIPAENVHQWQLKVYRAICNLEFKVTPNPADRLCHDGDTDHGAPPKPPPFL